MLNVKKKKPYNRADLREFDRLVDLMDSNRQLDRINGRLRFREWRKKFTDEVLEEMWQKIKDKYNK